MINSLKEIITSIYINLRLRLGLNAIRMSMATLYKSLIEDVVHLNLFKEYKDEAEIPENIISDIEEATQLNIDCRHSLEQTIRLIDALYFLKDKDIAQAMVKKSEESSEKCDKYFTFSETLKRNIINFLTEEDDV